MFCNYINFTKLKTHDNIKNNAKIFSDLERFAPLIPVPISWLDIDGILLGGNDLIFQVVGANAVRKQIIGKSLSEIYPKNVAETLMKNTKQVIQEKRSVPFEESIIDIETGRERWFLATRAPLFDNNGINVVGVVITSVEITDRKENERLRVETELQKIKLQEQLKFKKIVDQAAHDTQSPLAILLILAQQCNGLKKERIFETLKELTNSIPFGACWLDENNVSVGLNKQATSDLDVQSVNDVIGKTLYELYPYKIANNVTQHNNKVMKTGKVLSQETPPIKIAGKNKYFYIFKTPLYDDKEKLVGLFSVSVDITTEKNAELLKLETERQKTKIQEQERFGSVAKQVAHDIRSPLASMSMIVESCKDMTESKRIALRGAATGINDIANNLLNNYNTRSCSTPSETKTHQHILVSLALSEILSSKKYQYKNSQVTLNYSFKADGNFVFIKIDPSDFSRMISNLINNAVEAFEDGPGEVNLKLDLGDDLVYITIQDNGKGMPKKVVSKITKNISVTSGKKDGSGIGYTQIWDTLKSSNGKISIESKTGKGTKVTLTFPKIKSSTWIAECIEIEKGSTVVILDDDNSIHNAWKSRFEDHPSIHLKHFKKGNEAADFINSANAKDNLFLLSDLELINQKLNGLQIIEKTSMQNHSILVTSHHGHKKVRDSATKIGVKILPKQLASYVPIIVIESKKEDKISLMHFKKVDLVLIDDDHLLTDSMVNFFQDKVVDTYSSPKNFLKNMSQYDKNTRICMDHNFSGQKNGLELAAQLHDAGYKNLYMFSGTSFSKEKVPNYLTVILKGDMDSLHNLI